MWKNGQRVPMTAKKKENDRYSPDFEKTAPNNFILRRPAKERRMCAITPRTLFYIYETNVPKRPRGIMIIDLNYLITTCAPHLTTFLQQSNQTNNVINTTEVQFQLLSIHC